MSIAHISKHITYRPDEMPSVFRCICMPEKLRYPLAQRLVNKENDHSRYMLNEEMPKILFRKYRPDSGN